MLHVLDVVDANRRAYFQGPAQAHRVALGQFMTPAPVARFMASLFNPGSTKACRLLDAGAGMGALTAAVLERWATGGLVFNKARVRAYEVDSALRERLEQALIAFGSKLDVQAEIIATDFIPDAAARIRAGERVFTHAILNPPYKKMNTDSDHRRALRSVGIETVNLYSAFVALAVGMLAPGGQIVAIIPRSFCNGPYYRSFRNFLMERAAIRHMHLFGSRAKAFRDDDVLQENIIIHLERDAKQGRVTVSTSTDGSFADLAEHTYPFREIVRPGDSERFIHIPVRPASAAPALPESVRFSLADIGVQVSTGPVVDFRTRDHLRQMPEPGTVPLLYSGHFVGGSVEWPIPEGKKPNAIALNTRTEKWLYPNGHYCVVRRFSSKEERRRIVASVVNPAAFKGASMLGFENHLNVLHEDKHGMQAELAAGLAAFLNTTAVDDAFRSFNGHTQVNATDLRQMMYPSRTTLMKLGQWAMQQESLDQSRLDDRLERLAA